MVIFSGELEECDVPATLLFTHSMGGGTGSGLGTRISEEAADHVRTYELLLLNALDWNGMMAVGICMVFDRSLCVWYVLYIRNL